MATINELLGKDYSIRQTAGTQYPLVLTRIATKIFAELSDTLVRNINNCSFKDEHNDLHQYSCSICLREIKSKPIRMVVCKGKRAIHRECIKDIIAEFYFLCSEYQTAGNIYN